MAAAAANKQQRAAPAEVEVVTEPQALMEVRAVTGTASLDTEEWRLAQGPSTRFTLVAGEVAAPVPILTLAAMVAVAAASLFLACG